MGVSGAMNRARVITDLLVHFDQYVLDTGYILMSVRLVDASLIAITAPKQRAVMVRSWISKPGRSCAVRKAPR
jgi:hypothetical protein